jgi:hypothetical protein
MEQKASFESWLDAEENSFNNDIAMVRGWIKDAEDVKDVELVQFQHENLKCVQKSLNRIATARDLYADYNYRINGVGDVE